MGACSAELEELYGDLVMWKYLIQDLLGMVKYAPYGILIGSLMYVLLLWIRRRRNGEQKEAFSFVELLFWVYVAIMVVITFLSREGGAGNAKIDLQIGSSLGINSRNNAYIAENVLLFVPYGFLLGMVWKKERRFLNHLCLGFLTSFGIECLQLVSGRGIFQADDMITNTVGCVLGTIIFLIFVRRYITKEDVYEREYGQTGGGSGKR